MSCAAISQKQVYEAGSKERRQDLMYQMLVFSNSEERTKLTNGLQKFIKSRITHPAVDEMFSCVPMPPLLERAIVLAALVQEPDFLQHMMDRTDTCSSSLSQYVVDVLPPHLNQLLNGVCNMRQFVMNATHAYIIL